MTHRQRLFAGLSGLLLVAALAALFVEVDAGARGARVLAELGSALGADVRAESQAVGLRRGLVLGGVRVASRRSGGPTLVAERVEIDPSWLAWLSGRPAIDGARLVRPTLTITAAPPRSPAPAPPRPPADPGASRVPPAPRPEPPPSSEAPAALVLGRLSVEDGALVVASADGAARERLAGLDVELRDVRLARGNLAGEGTVSVTTADLDVGHVEDAAGAVRLSGSSVALRDLRFRSELGSVRADVELSWTGSDLRHRTTARVDPLDLLRLVDSPEPEGFGRARLAVSAQGSTGDPDARTGEGTLTVEPGRLPYFPLLAHLDDMLRQLTLWDSPHEAVEARFKLEGRRIELEPFDVHSPGLVLSVSGSVGTGGALGLDLRFLADPERVSLDGVPADLARVLPTARGPLGLPARVRGTASAPVVEPDADALVARARGEGKVFDEARVRQALARLFAASGS